MISNKKRAQKREKTAAKELGGRSIVGSGSLWFDKGDIKTDKFLIEDKFTDNDSYIIKLATLNTIEKHANKVTKVPVLRFGFEKYNTNYVLVKTGYYTDINPLVDDYFKYRIETDSKSLTVYHDYFEKLEITEQGPILCYIIFKEKQYIHPFAVLTWDDFKKNQQIFKV